MNLWAQYDYRKRKHSYNNTFRESKILIYYTCEIHCDMLQRPGHLRKRMLWTFGREIHRIID